MKPWRCMLLGPLAWGSLFLELLAVAVGGAQSAQSAPPPTAAPEPVRLKPDYTGVTIPPNIAPFSFVILEPNVTRQVVTLTPTVGKPLEIPGKDGEVNFPTQAWHTLLAENTGQPIYFEIRVQTSDGPWKSFGRVTNFVSSDPIDGHLAYRLLRPVYNLYGPVGIYQRDLANYEQRPVLENKRLDQGCLNCHTFLNHQPDKMALHIRNKEAGNPMLLVTSNEVTRINKTAGYITWHPSGRLLAFSVNKFALLFHTAGETRDLYDGASDLGIYRVDSNVVLSPPPISRPDRLETWPHWAPDGRHLYFCAAPQLRIERLKQIRYDLMRVPYDIASDKWGEPEIVVSAQDTHMSAAQPRVSPNGRWLLFCLSPYGNFPAYSPGSDLYLMDLTTRQMRRLEINSDVSDSWHCWSSNNRWVVFSSKRLDGLFTRPYFTHVSEDGQFSKPFILPQEDPRFYESFGFTFNLPELIQRPVTVSEKELARGALRPRRQLKPISAEPPSARPEHEADEGRSAELTNPGGPPR